MGPKKKSELGENEWRTDIEEAQLDEETWKVKVILIESAGNEQERMYINKFEIFAAEEKRFVIKNISKTEIIFMINQLGSDKKVKDANLRVFEECQSYLADKKDIPPDVLALAIKHLILKMKDEYLYIRRQKLEVKDGMQRESATMLKKAEVRGTVFTQKEDVPLAVPEKIGKGKADASARKDSQGKKFNTQLRVRGEEWRDKVYIDDYPPDGPHLYVAITGFAEPYLPGSLVKVGIPLTGVVQVRINLSMTSIPSTLLKTTKRDQSVTEILAKKSIKFWDEIQMLRIHENTANDYKDTAFIIFSPPYWNTDVLSATPDKIYDELCYLMFDIQDLYRQHLHYKDNMGIIHIPEDVGNNNFTKYYKQNINDLPLECVTIYSILDIILQTACNEHLDDVASRSSLLTADTLVPLPKNMTEENKLESSENLIKNIFNTLCSTEASKKSYRLTYGQEYEENREPIVLGYGDFAKYNTFHLGNINLDNIVFSSLVGMPINNLWQNQALPSDELEAKINFHVNVLLSCFDREGVETAELHRLMNILACRKLYSNRSSLKKLHLLHSTISEFKKKYLKRSIFAQPLPQCPSLGNSSHLLPPSFPSMSKTENLYECSNSESDADPEVQRLKLLFECPDISELVTAAEIENNQPVKNDMIDDFDFFEDLSRNCAFQILREAFNKFNCVDYKYCEVTDCFILMFFNSHDKEGIAREEWRNHLATPLCLQDFFDFILDEQYDWIQSEEKKYDEILLKEAQSVSKDFVDPNAPQTCVGTTNVEMDLLMEGSLKYEEIVQFEDSVQETTEITRSLPTTSPRSVDRESKASKIPKKPVKNKPVIPEMEEQSVEIRTKHILGYDLGERRVEAFGKDATFFSRDGTKVSSAYTLTIPMNLEYIGLNILPGNSYNEFWMHKALGDFVKPDIKDTCESFRITSKDQVIIYIKKRMYQVVPVPSTFDVINNEKKKDTDLVSHSVITTMNEAKYFHSLFVTWPNGMITETVYENNSPVMSHIKQYHTCQMPHLNEEMRCISLNGEVIIFKPSGFIEVLKPDGTWVQIKRYFRRVVPVVESEHAPEPTESLGRDKKSKSKLGKGKNVEKAEEKINETKPEYEIVVNEFEIIEPNGLRQQWIGDVPFDIEKLLIKTATDYCQEEVFSRRMDGTNILINKNGLQSVTFPDKTRIVTSLEVDVEEIYPEWTDEELEYFEMFEPDKIECPGSKTSVSHKSIKSSHTVSSKKLEEEEIKENVRTDGYILIHIMYTIEHKNFSTVSINNVKGTISVESPNGTVVIVDRNNNYDIKLNNETSANFDGENLSISYQACTECCAFTKCNIKIMTNDENNTNNSKEEQIWLKMTDSFNIQVVVNDEGEINIADNQASSEITPTENIEYGNKNNSDTENKEPDNKSESSVVSHGKCREMYLAKNIRFFILRRDLSCAEVLHRALVEEYQRACRWQPWCSINQYDTFGDHRNLVSILTPVQLTEPEKWLMPSKQANKPMFLTYKDLKTDSGKGFYHWMRPYERFAPQPQKPDNVLPERLPRAYILRTLEQQWDQTKRKELKGAKELLAAILRYRAIMESGCDQCINIPIVDPRPEDERRIDDMIQALAHKIYEDLKVRIADDLESRAKLTITTKPPLVEPEEAMSFEGEFSEEATDEAKSIKEEQERLVKEAEAAEEMSPALQRYWRRRGEEYKEEQFYKYILREGSVPPYFRNVLGGAIWWDINNATSEAVTLSERRKMKCGCANKDATSISDTTHERFT